MSFCEPKRLELETSLSANSNGGISSRIIGQLECCLYQEEGSANSTISLPCMQVSPKQPLRNSGPPSWGVFGPAARCSVCGGPSRRRRLEEVFFCRRLLSRTQITGSSCSVHSRGFIAAVARGAGGAPILCAAPGRRRKTGTLLHPTPLSQGRVVMLSCCWQATLKCVEWIYSLLSIMQTGSL
jgi:hypothetical protein